jgi:hypothetical protein
VKSIFAVGVTIRQIPLLTIRIKYGEQGKLILKS